MKKLLLLIPLLTGLSQAQITPTEDAFCAQVLTFAISPEGTCSEFPTSCIPEDHKAVSSCESTESSSSQTSLEDRLLQRKHGKKRLRVGPTVTKKQVSGKFKRFGRVQSNRAFTRNTSSKRTKPSTGLDRRSTAKNFRSQFRRHNVKGGFNRGDKIAQAGHRDARIRPQLFSRSLVRRVGSFSDKPKWEISQRSHFSERRIGQTNPFSIRSVRSAQQRARRANQESSTVDVEARRLSRSRRWRPGRLDGNLSGDPDFILEQAEKRARIQEDLFNQEQ